MQRALAAGLLAEGTSIIRNPSFCNDALAAMKVVEGLGASVNYTNKEVVIDGGFNPFAKELDCGESGLAIRMFTSIASLHDAPITLTGSGSLTSRPMNMIGESLQSLGVEFDSRNGCIPITVKGPLKGGQASVDGSTSSQFLTGLLMALPLLKQKSELHVEDLKSRPYIDLTIQVQKDFGVNIQHKQYSTFFINGGQHYQPCTYTVEGDWSGAAFLLVAGAIGGKVEVTSLNPYSRQADRAIVEALEKAGAKVTFGENSVTVIKDKLRPFEFNATECPDLFPPLVALAAHCDGTTLIKGIARLIHKESNRADVLKKEFSKIGATIELAGGGMLIRGGQVKGGTIHSNNDHRIAMAGAVASCASENPIHIEAFDAVKKSYPEFADDFIKLGGCTCE
jgi:3-phosphoshikimate 1-carboxyvinyltransferase